MRFPAFLYGFLASSLLACGSSQSSGSGSDAGDSGSALPADSGSPLLDSGAARTDSGAAGADSGVSGADSGSPVDSGGLADSGVPMDSGVPADSGVVADSGSPPDSGVMEMTYMLHPGDCFTYATATSSHSNGLSCGDLLALSGANVDLSSPNGPDGNGGICDQQGTYTSLSQVPVSYATCMWTSYLEGLNGLTNHGLIVRDAAQVHHYRMHILTNAQPALVFSFGQID